MHFDLVVKVVHFSTGKVETWTGIRNFTARNNLKSMRIGDRAFFYHSSCKVPGIVGTVRVVREAFPDPLQFDPSSKYYDAKSTPENPRWVSVDVALEYVYAEVRLYLPI